MVLTQEPWLEPQRGYIPNSPTVHVRSKRRRLSTTLKIALWWWHAAPVAAALISSQSSDHALTANRTLHAFERVWMDPGVAKIWFPVPLQGPFRQLPQGYPCCGHLLRSLFTIVTPPYDFFATNCAP